MTNIILDATVLSGIMSCARFADFRNNRNYVHLSGKSNSLEIGSIAHRILEFYYKSRIQGLNRTDAIANGFIAGEAYIKGLPFCLNCYSFDIESYLPPLYRCHKCNTEFKFDDRNLEGVQNTFEEDETKPVRIGWRRVFKTLEEYFDYYRNDPWIPLEAECVKKILLYEDDDIRILWKGKLDTIFDTNDGLIPTDHKTSSQRRDLLDLNNQFMGQCILIGVRRMVVNHIGWQKSLKSEEKFTRELMSYSISRLTEWQNVIVPYWAKRLIQYAETEFWPPNYSHCENKYGACIFHKVCQSDVTFRQEELMRNFKVGPEWDITDD